MAHANRNHDGVIMDFVNAVRFTYGGTARFYKCPVCGAQADRKRMGGKTLVCFGDASTGGQRLIDADVAYRLYKKA